MAKPYVLPGGLDSLLQPSTADRIIGSREGQRATKTYINTEAGAQDLALILRHARSIIRRVMMLHNNRATKAFIAAPEDDSDWKQRKLSWEQVCEHYPGAQTWNELHQFFVEHYASQEGFAVGATVRLAQTQLLEEKKKAESSIQAGGSSES